MLVGARLSFIAGAAAAVFIPQNRAVAGVATALASAEYSTYVKANLIDANNATRLIPYPPAINASSGNVYCGVDLGARYPVDTVKLYFGNCPTALKIQYSDDSSTWHTAKVLSLTSGDKAMLNTYTFKAVAARYWRCLSGSNSDVSGNHSSGADFYTLEVWDAEVGGFGSTPYDNTNDTYMVGKGTDSSAGGDQWTSAGLVNASSGALHIGKYYQTAKSVSNLYIYLGNAPDSLKVQSSDDGSSWTDRHTFAVTSSGEKNESFSGATAKYWRVISNSNTAYGGGASGNGWTVYALNFT